MLPRDDATSLPLLYHLNSEPWFNFEAYRSSAYEPPRAFPAPGRCLDLSPAGPMSPLQTLLRARQSCRQFAERPLSLSELTALLHGAYGIVGGMQSTNGSWAVARPRDVFLEDHRESGRGDRGEVARGLVARRDPQSFHPEPGEERLRLARL